MVIDAALYYAQWQPLVCWDVLVCNFIGNAINKLKVLLTGVSVKSG